jgi:hypothetical protein
LPHQRGHWLDRLPAIDDDIRLLEKQLESATGGKTESKYVHAAVREALGRPQRISITCIHTPPAQFVPSQALEIILSVKEEKATPISIRLHYRHVNQAESYQTVEMLRQNGRYQAVLPRAYTASSFLLQYYFELKQRSGKAWLWPGFAPDFANQPYYVVQPTR